MFNVGDKVQVIDEILPNYSESFRNWIRGRVLEVTSVGGTVHVWDTVEVKYDPPYRSFVKRDIFRSTWLKLAERRKPTMEMELESV